MGCFLVPMAEAIVVSAVKKNEEKKEAQADISITSNEGACHTHTRSIWSRKLGILNKMLWGGSALLLFEHIWHGEVTFVAPFFTTLTTSANLGPFFMELATAGAAMSVAITAVWAVIVQIAAYKEKQALAKEI